MSGFNVELKFERFDEETELEEVTDQVYMLIDNDGCYIHAYVENGCWHSMQAHDSIRRHSIKYFAELPSPQIIHKSAVMAIRSESNRLWHINLTYPYTYIGDIVFYPKESMFYFKPASANVNLSVLMLSEIEDIIQNIARFPVEVETEE